MTIDSLILSNNIIFGDTIFNFEDASTINTVSGKNGAGKTSLFSIITTIQKAYFADLLLQSNFENYDSKRVNSIVETDCHRYISDGNNSKATLRLRFDEKDYKLLSARDQEYIQALLQNIQVDQKEDDHHVILVLNLEVNSSISSFYDYSRDWKINVEDEAQNTLLQYFWNLKMPRDLILYMTAERKVQEQSMTMESIRLQRDSDVSRIVDVVLASEDIYDNLYRTMIDDYLLERIDPRKGEGKRNKYFIDGKNAFNKLIPDLKINNFSSKQVVGQFVLCVKKKRHRDFIDIRNLSSGEKLIWYSLLLLYYVKDVGVLIIDEPENHLHEELAWKFVIYLSDICGGKVNNASLSEVFLLTHSKNLIYNNFSSGTNYLLEDEQLNRLEYENAEEKMRHIGLSFVDEKVLFVEGETDVIILTQLLELYNIKIQSLNSCQDVIKTYEGLQRIAQYVQDKRVVFLIDRDTRDDDDIQRIRNENSEYFEKHFVVLDQHEIENYLLDVDLIYTVLHEKFSVVTKKANLWTQDRIKSLERKYADQLKEQTEKKYLNSFIHGKLNANDGLIKQKDIPVASVDSFNNYIDHVFDGENWKAFIRSLKNGYQHMSSKYRDEEWESHWTDLCDGKIVWQRTTCDIAKDIGVKTELLRDNILLANSEKSGSQLNTLKNKIVNMFE